MKVLVTGAAGFIGSNVAKYLESKSIGTVLFDDFSHSDYRNLLGLKGEVICGSVTGRDFEQIIPEVDAVIHEAAITDTTLADDAKMVRVNYNGFKNAFAFCVKKNIPLVYASSAGVYGRAGQKMSEQQKLIPHNTYAYSKYLCDCLANKYIKTNQSPPVIGLRYFNVYGPGEAHKEKSASMIYQLYNQMIQGRQPRIFKFGKQKRDFVYIKDVARITADSINLGKSALFNLGTGEPRTFNDVISILNQGLDKNLATEYIDNPYENVYQNYTEADTTILKTVFAEGARYNLEDGIKDYLENHLIGDK